MIFNQTIWQPEIAAAELVETALGASYVFVNLQDHLRPDLPEWMFETALTYLRALEALTAPLLVFSLAANGLQAQTHDVAANLGFQQKRFFGYLNERATSIGVRGEATADVMAQLGLKNTAVVGCPTYFEMGAGRRVDPVDAGSSRPIGLTGLFAPHKAGDAHRYLQGDYEWPLINLAYMPDALWRARDLCGGRELPTDGNHIARALLEERAHFLPDIDHWRSHVGATCSAVIGDRLHGAILALNAGVPAIVTNRDRRSQESCEYFGVPRLDPHLAARLTKTELLACCDVDCVNELYDKRFATFRDWLASCDLTLSCTPDAALDSIQVPQQSVPVIRARLIDETKRIIAKVYQRELGRAPSIAETDTWLATLQHKSFVVMIDALRSSAEAIAFRDTRIRREYRSYFGRDPYADELATWLSILSTDGTLDDLRQTLLSSPEAQNYVTLQIKLAYTEVFEREASEAEITTWLGTINGGATIEDVRHTLLIAPEGQPVAVQTIRRVYRSTLDREPSEAEQLTWLGALRATDLMIQMMHGFGVAA